MRPRGAKISDDGRVRMIVVLGDSRNALHKLRIAETRRIPNCPRVPRTVVRYLGQTNLLPAPITKMALHRPDLGAVERQVAR